MEFTPIEEVRQGFWFVRKILSSEYTSRSPWAIAKIKGHFPFLYGAVIVFDTDTNDAYFLDQVLSRGTEILNPNEWEFGPRIEFPHD